MNAMRSGFISVLVFALLAFGIVSASSTTSGSRTSGLQTVYVGHSITCGRFTATLVDLGISNASGVSLAVVNVYYRSILTNASAIWPANTVTYNVNGHMAHLYIKSTFNGLFAYQKWAKMQLSC